MLNKNLLLTAGALVAGLAAVTSAQAQGPLYDKVIVDLPYAVTINNTSLQPGHYEIRQLQDASANSRVLMIFGNNGMKLKATALTIPALKLDTPEHTSVVLHHYGNDYYFDKVWIQGKNYGYEFPLPSAVKARQREALQPYTVAANYEQTSEAATEATQITQAAPAASGSVLETRTEVAQAAPAPAMADTSSNNSGLNTNAAPAPASEPAMPHTAGNWLGLLLSGGMLSGAGMMLRKLRS